MTKSLRTNYPLIADILKDTHAYTVPNNQGIDTIELIARYETVIKLFERMGLMVEAMPKGNKIFKSIEYEIKEDKHTRLNQEAFSPMVECVKLPKVNPKDKSFYIGIVRNTPSLFKVADYHKKRKDTYCKLVFAGVHQPTKKISSEAIKIISTLLKRKAFKLHRVDIAIDFKSHESINHSNKKTFKDNLMPLSKRGVICEGSSYYINKLDHPSISRINLYDKHKKQLNQQGEEKITNELKAWKRLEITLTFDVTQRNNKGFMHYIESLNFIDDLYEVQAVATKAKIKSYDSDYLIYQLNSFIDNRFMNNHESKKQFNSVESLERFKTSDFRRYVLAI